MFGDKVDELIVDYVKSPDEFFAVLRRVMHTAGQQIQRSFDSLSQDQSVPKTVLALTSAMIDEKITSSDQLTKEALSVGQIIVSQTSKPSKRRAKLKKTTRRSHCKNQETLLLRYVGLKIFYNTRSRKVIDDLYHAGQIV